MCSTKQGPQMSKGSEPKVFWKTCSREISTLSRLHNGCKKRTVNTQQDLSEWRTMYHGHGYLPWDHPDTLKLTQTWERTPVQEVKRGILWRNGYSSEASSELLQGLWSSRNAPRVFSSGNTQRNRYVKSLVEHFSNNYLIEEEDPSIIAQWPALSTRLVRQKAIGPNDVFSILVASRPNGFKDRLILLDLNLTSTPSTGKCEPGFSAMNHLKCNLTTTLRQNTLSDLMPMRSSDYAKKAYRPNSAISNWFSGAKTKRHMVEIFKLTPGIPKLSANLLMMFIPGTLFMLGVQTRN